MTLILTIVAPWGVWQSSDHRLTDVQPGGRIVGARPNYSIKHVTIRCNDGGALVGYTGLGRVNGADVSDWLRRQLRGESRSLDETLILIRERADKYLAKPAV